MFGIFDFSFKCSKLSKTFVDRWGILTNLLTTRKEASNKNIYLKVIKIINKVKDTETKSDPRMSHSVIVFAIAKYSFAQQSIVLAFVPILDRDSEFSHIN